MNPPPLLTARRALFPRCGAARTEHSPLFSSAERPGGSASDQGAAQGPGGSPVRIFAHCVGVLKLPSRFPTSARHYIRDIRDFPEIHTGGRSWRLPPRPPPPLTAR